LRQLGATDEQIDEIFSYVAPLPVEAQEEFQSEGWLKDNIIDPLFTGAVQFAHGIKTTVSSLLPMLFTKEPTVTREEYIGPKEWYDWQQSVKEDLEQSAEERFIRYTAEHEEWMRKHPELAPKPEFAGPFDVSLLKDPGYIPFLFMSSLAYSLSVLGTIAGVTAATGGNIYAGLGAGMAVAGMPEASDMTKELLDQGVPFREATEWGTLYGAVVGGIESVSDLPVLGILFKPAKMAVQPIMKTMLRLTANRIVKATIMAAIIPATEGMEELVTQAAHNAILRHYDDTVSIFENVDDAFIKGALASVPFAGLGGVSSYRSFRQALPEETRTEMDNLVERFKKSGATEEQSQVMAANEIDLYQPLMSLSRVIFQPCRQFSKTMLMIIRTYHRVWVRNTRM